MITKDVLELINEDYGSRKVFISDLAQKLGISYAHANKLTQLAGYNRTKKLKDISLAEFSQNRTVQYIVNKIP